MSTFEQRDAFIIGGRGQCLAGIATGRVEVGMRMRFRDCFVVIKGVERHPVYGALEETHRRPLGLLVSDHVDDIDRVWEIDELP